MSIGEKTMISNAFLICPLHKRQIQSMIKYYSDIPQNNSIINNSNNSNNSNSNNNHNNVLLQQSILKCSRCCKEENIHPNKLIDLSEFFQDEDESDVLFDDWPIAKIYQYYTEIMQKLDQFEEDTIKQIFKKFKTQIIHKLDLIQDKVLDSFLEINLNRDRINKYFKSISRKEEVQKLILDLNKDLSNSTEKLLEIIKNNDKQQNNYISNIQQISNNLQFYYDKFSIQQLENIHHEINILFDNYSEIFEKKIENVIVIEKDNILPITPLQQINNNKNNNNNNNFLLKMNNLNKFKSKNIQLKRNNYNSFNHRSTQTNQSNNDIRMNKLSRRYCYPKKIVQFQSNNYGEQQSQQQQQQSQLQTDDEELQYIREEQEQQQLCQLQQQLDEEEEEEEQQEEEQEEEEQDEDDEEEEGQIEIENMRDNNNNQNIFSENMEDEDDDEDEDQQEDDDDVDEEEDIQNQSYSRQRNSHLSDIAYYSKKYTDNYYH